MDKYNEFRRLFAEAYPYLSDYHLKDQEIDRLLDMANDNQSLALNYAQDYLLSQGRCQVTL